MTEGPQAPPLLAPLGPAPAPAAAEPVPPGIMLAAALSYAERGLAVVPYYPPKDGRCTCKDGANCEHPGKHPRTPQGFNDACTDPATIEAWWRRWPDSNIGIMLSMSGLIGIDVDPRNKGDVTLAALEAAHGALPRTVQSLSGGGGRHFLFKRPGGELRGGPDTLGPGLDVICKGAIVAPPSAHVSGGQYRWEGDSDPGEVAVAPCPEWVLAKLRPAPRKPTPAPAPRPVNGKGNRRLARYIEKALQAETARVQSAPDGRRNASLNAAAFSLGTLVGGGYVDRATVEGALTAAATEAGLGAPEIAKTLRSGLDAGMAEPRHVDVDQEYRPMDKTPAPLPERLPFPVEALPPVTRRFVVEAAEALGVDLAYLALPTLAALASAIGNTRRLQVKRDWVPPSVLWTGIVGESGTMKSPALKLALDFVQRRQAAAREAHVERLNEYKARALAYKVDLKTWERDGKAAGAAPPVEPARPKMERFIVSDVTVEALADRLEDAPRGLLVARDELSGWLASFGAYKQGRGRDEANYLSMYDAGPLQVDRKNPDRPSIHVPQAAVSICGGIQTPVLARLLTADSYECGLAARLLLTLPPRQMKTWRDGEVSQIAEDRMAAVYERLYGLAFIDPDGRGKRPKTLHLTAEARETFKSFVNRNGAETADLTGNLAAAYAKLDGAAARFALVLALARWAEDPTADGLGPDVVDAQDVEAGIALAEWFKVETRRVYSILVETESERRRRQLVELLRRKGGMTPRELQQSRSYATAAEAEAALKDLEDCGLAAGEYVCDPKGGPGKWVYRPTQPAADSEK